MSESTVPADPTPFQKFRELARKIVSVPKKEADEAAKQQKAVKVETKPKP